MTRRDPAHKCGFRLSEDCKGQSSATRVAGSLSTHADCNQPFLAFSCPLLLAFLGLFSSNPNSVISAPGVHTVRGLNGVPVFNSFKSNPDGKHATRVLAIASTTRFDGFISMSAAPPCPAYLNSPLFQSSHFCISIFSCAFLLLRFL